MARVLLVGKGAPERGGIAAFLGMLSTGALRDRHDLEFLNLTRDGQPRGGRFTASNLARTAADAAAVWRMSRDRDVVHVHSAVVPTVTLARACLFALVARARGVSVVVHAHGGLLTSWLTSPARRIVARVLLFPFASVVAVADSVADVLRPCVRAARLVTIANGIDVQVFTPRAAPAATSVPRILYAGLLTPRKGLLDLFDASLELRRRGCDHELWIVGGTPDEGADAERAVRAAFPGAGARDLGPQTPDAMPDLYRSADVFCLPSWWEAMPLTVLEAMATGLPVVATDVGDVDRLVVHEETGLLVPPARPDLLADQLARLLADPAERQRFGAAGRARAAGVFPLSATVDRIDGLYTELTGSAS